MKNIYLYGASDDCHECETSWGDFESYNGFYIGPVAARFTFDHGNWGIWLTGDVPSDWIVKTIHGNCPPSVRNRTYGGQFIHIQVPEQVKVVEIEE